MKAGDFIISKDMLEEGSVKLSLIYFLFDRTKQDCLIIGYDSTITDWSTEDTEYAMTIVPKKYLDLKSKFSKKIIYYALKDRFSDI